MRKIDLKNFQVATSETARDINRRIVLNFLRANEPISRADLARQSGLQFSTVSLIVEELIAEQWVTEGAIISAPRGRKPRVLHFNYDKTRIIGVDIRPRVTTVAMSDLNGRFVSVERLDTSENPSQFIGELASWLADLVRRQPYNFAGIGVSLPGRVAIEAERLAFAPNLGWRDLDVKGPLEAATGLPVLLENAPNACALAEMWFGRYADKVQDLVAVTVSEGVGAGIFMNGQLLRGPTGMAGEFGHVSLDPDGPLCGCGQRGCWEAFASNLAAVRYYREETASTQVSKTNNSQSRISANRTREPLPPNSPPVAGFEDLLIRVNEGDLAARRALERMATWLGAGLAMITTSLAPSVVVVVGEVTAVWDIVGPILKSTVSERVQRHLPTEIVPTDDLVHPRLRGAVAVVLHHQLGAPLLA